MATAMTFFISAFFHEYLVSVPLRTYKVSAINVSKIDQYDFDEFLFNMND